jgi:hypothetical protein
VPQDTLHAPCYSEPLWRGGIQGLGGCPLLPALGSPMSIVPMAGLRGDIGFFLTQGRPASQVLRVGSKKVVDLTYRVFHISCLIMHNHTDIVSAHALRNFTGSLSVWRGLSHCQARCLPPGCDSLPRPWRPALPPGRGRVRVARPCSAIARQGSPVSSRPRKPLWPDRPNLRP